MSYLKVLGIYIPIFRSIAPQTPNVAFWLQCSVLGRWRLPAPTSEAFGDPSGAFSTKKALLALRVLLK
jgi:hypothetical protein